MNLIVGVVYETADGRKARCMSYQPGNKALCKVDGHDDEVLYTRTGFYVDVGVSTGRERLWQIIR